MSNNAIEALLKARNRLVAEKDATLSRLNGEIQELETAIERLSGKKVWEIEPVLAYDDENPDYIRQSAEEI